MQLSRHKLVESGAYLHHYHYSLPIAYDYSTIKPKASSVPPRAENSEKPKSNDWRAKRQIRYIIEANASDKRNKLSRPIFATLTFAENVRELTKANLEFKNFIKRFNYETFKDSQKVRYIFVPEFQKRGAVHYHGIFFNLPFINNIYDHFRDTWRQGYVWIEAIDDPNQLTNYLSKYFTKSEDFDKIKSRKRYFCSRDIKRPKVHRNIDVITELLSVLSKPLYKRSYDTLSGSVNYAHLLML